MLLSRWVIVAILTAVLVPGCGRRAPPLPTTYPVHGKVTYADGTAVTGGLVQFLPQTEPTVVTNAEIQKDGTYSLKTFRDRQRAEGAVAGPNRATAVITSSGGGMGVAPYIFPKPYVVEARDNEFNLQLGKASH